MVAVDLGEALRVHAVADGVVQGPEAAEARVVHVVEAGHARDVGRGRQLHEDGGGLDEVALGDALLAVLPAAAEDVLLGHGGEIHFVDSDEEVHDLVRDRGALNEEGVELAAVDDAEEGVGVHLRDGDGRGLAALEGIVALVEAVGEDVLEVGVHLDEAAAEQAGGKVELGHVRGENGHAPQRGHRVLWEAEAEVQNLRRGVLGDVVHEGLRACLRSDGGVDVLLVGIQDLQRAREGGARNVVAAVGAGERESHEEVAAAGRGALDVLLLLNGLLESLAGVVTAGEVARATVLLDHGLAEHHGGLHEAVLLQLLHTNRVELLGRELNDEVGVGTTHLGAVVVAGREALEEHRTLREIAGGGDEEEG
eukprot:PhM_4_TR1283/c1_g1_i2/m.7326